MAKMGPDDLLLVEVIIVNVFPTPWHLTILLSNALTPFSTTLKEFRVSRQPTVLGCVPVRYPTFFKYPTKSNFENHWGHKVPAISGIPKMT